jgi:hypothetical protein
MLKIFNNNSVPRINSKGKRKYKQKLRTLKFRGGCLVLLEVSAGNYMARE